MNIEHKKTTLDDDSAFYNKGKDTVTKEELKNLSSKQKFQYFLDYHLKKVIVIGAVVIFAAVLLNTMIFNRTENAMTVAYINDCNITDTETLETDMRDFLDIPDKHDTVGSSYYYTEDYQMNMAFYTHVAAGGVDLIVCDEESFKDIAEGGMLADLSTYLSEDIYEKLSDHIIMAQMADETDTEGNVYSYYPEQAFGIDITGNTYYESLGGTPTDPLILCVAAGSENQENALKLLLALCETIA